MLLAINTELLVAGTGAAMAIAGVVIVAWFGRSQRLQPRVRWLAWAFGPVVSVIGMTVAMNTYIADSGWGQWLESMALWILPVVGNALICGGAAIAAWSLLADRARGRKRCPRCWYDMSGAASLVCPECGCDAKEPKRLLRTRRHKRLAAIGVFLILLGCLRFAEPWVRSGQWWRQVPTRVLIYAIPWAERPNSRYLLELHNRITDYRQIQITYPNSWTVLPRVAPLSQDLRALLLRRTCDALLLKTHPDRENLFSLLPDLITPGSQSERVEAVVLAGLVDTNPTNQCAAASAANRLKIKDEKAFLEAALDIAASWQGSGYPQLHQQQALAAIAKLMASLGPKDPRVVPALVNLLSVPESLKDYVVHTEVMWALAQIGPDARSALPSIRPPVGYEPWNGHDSIRHYAVLMIEGKLGGRREVLLAMLRHEAWLLRSFAVEEFAKDPADEDSIRAVRGALGDEMNWVRLAAADTLLKWNQHTEESRAFIAAELESGNLDVGYKVVDLAIRHGLDLAPIESRVKAYYGDPLNPRGNVEGLLRKIADEHARRSEAKK